MMKRLFAILLILIALTMIGSAYQIPAEYRGQVHNDVDLYVLMQSHLNEQWTAYPMRDLEIHYVGRGREKLDTYMQYLMGTNMGMPALPMPPGMP